MSIPIELVEPYLRRLGVVVEPPSADALARLHRAHVERVPYETTWIALGELWDTDPVRSAERITLRSRGGYCFHLNGAFASLLAALGYRVTLHTGGVHGPEPDRGDLGNHLVVVVTGLPTGDAPDGRWYVDVGLGDALHDPLPLAPGRRPQGPFTFELAADVTIGDWRLTHDPRGSFATMSFRRRATTIASFEGRHGTLSTSPDSPFVRTTTAQRRDRGGVTAVRALTVTVLDAAGSTSTDVTDRSGWFALLADEFHLRFDELDAAARDRLWRRVNAQHERKRAAPRT